MPYILKNNRIKLAEGMPPQEAGHLNYLFSKICGEYLREHGESYQRYNDIIGALEGAKLEIYRRLVAPYEETKQELNGDIY